MKTDKEIGGLICKIAQNTVEYFKKSPNPPSIRFFGSLGKAVYTGEVPKSNIYDLDIDIIGNSSQQRDAVNLYANIASQHNSPTIIIEAKKVGGVVKPTLHFSKRKLFLHLMPMTEHQVGNYPKNIKYSMCQYGAQIVGELPYVAQINRIGLADILSEAPKRISQITGTAKGENAINRVFDDDKITEIPNQTQPDSLENLSYSVRNNAANVMAAIQPYISTPHFDNSPKVFQDFYSTFKTHPWKNLPLEINALTKQERNGKKINTQGLKREALNFLAYNDQMIRNMVGQ